MKRIFSTIFVAAALLAASVQASAQYFDHLSVGVGAGFDGVSLQLAVPMGDYMQLRAGGSYMPPFSIVKNVKDFEYQEGETVDLNIRGQLQISAFNAMIDFFPGKKTGFHFTAGVFAGDRTIATAYNTEPYLDEKEWGVSGITVGNTLITTDSKGISRVNLDINKFLPYLGIGAGRAARDRAVNFVFDFGAIYTGGLGIYTKGTNLKTGEEDYIRITSQDIKDNGQDDQGIVDKVYSIPVLPMMKFSLFFRIF